MKTDGEAGCVASKQQDCYRPLWVFVPSGTLSLSAGLLSRAEVALCCLAMKRQQVSVLDANLSRKG